MSAIASQADESAETSVLDHYISYIAWSLPLGLSYSPSGVLDPMLLANQSYHSGMSMGLLCWNLRALGLICRSLVLHRARKGSD